MSNQSENSNSQQTTNPTQGTHSDNLVLVLFFVLSALVFYYCTLPGALFIIGRSKVNPGSFCLLLGGLWILGISEYLISMGNRA